MGMVVIVGDVVIVEQGTAGTLRAGNPRFEYISVVMVQYDETSCTSSILP